MKRPGFLSSLGGFLVLAQLVCGLSPAWAAPTDTALKIPALTGPVVDDAQLLTSGEVARLETAVRQLFDHGNVQLTILIVPNLQGLDVETYAVKVFESWKLGQKGKDRGMLFVVCPGEHKMRLEVGYGLEGDITDAFSKDILTDRVAPYFRAGRYGDGILVAVQSIAAKLGVDLGGGGDEDYSQFRGRRRGHVPVIFVLFLIILYVLMSGFFGPFFWGGGGWGGGGGLGGGGWGGGDGGGWSGGGGGSGGGGASSDW